LIPLTKQESTTKKYVRSSFKGRSRIGMVGWVVLLLHVDLTQIFNDVVRAFLVWAKRQIHGKFPFNTPVPLRISSAGHRQDRHFFVYLLLAAAAVHLGT
jgi:hypothetical protein